ncbi:ATPase [Marinobacter orientalis]|uniref:ATPase n=1 Tax=Marinobacter orientalis TaxID=1928859 RepID=A0A7Y0RAQ3_9GAMM|nr:ATPase [Marinobacter orientalis]NMT62387.1 ATPase [Marinobacter orientalis]TGX51090.1 ATPase [Marinobacter orientalis]
MDIKTFEDLIIWARELHANLSRCLSECSSKHPNEQAQGLLTYLAGHESELARITAEFEKQAAPNALKTRVYDYLNGEHKRIKAHETCDGHYADLDFDGIEREVFAFHDQLIDLYDSLAGKAEIPEAKELVESMRTMEEQEAMRLASQVSRMNDV